MFCPKCGAQIPEGATFCVGCGAAAQASVTPQTPAADTSNQETMAFSAIPEAPVQPAGYTPDQYNYQPAPAKNGNGGKVALIVVICVLIVGLLATLAILFLPKLFGNVEDIEGGSRRHPGSSQTQNDTTEEEEVERTIGTVSSSNPYSTDFVDADTYVLSASNTKYYSRAELSAMTRQQLYLAERELFARYGGTFQDGDLAEFFNAKSWYNPDSPAANFNESRFTDIERVNLLVLRALLMERDGTAATNPYTKINNNVEGFILPFTDSSRITKDDVKNLDEKELIIAYNEIYARKGYIFEDNDLQLYFSGKNWYTPSMLPGSFNTTAELNEIEQDNYACLQQCVEKLKGVRFSAGNKYKNCYNTYTGYVCPTSDTTKLNPYDLKLMSAEELMIARNEIYARYGYVYTLTDLREYFMNCSWYYPTVANGKLALIKLTTIEEFNVKLLQAFELNLKLRKGEGTVNTKMSYYAKHDYMTMYLPEHWRDHCVCVKPTGLSGNLEFYEKYNHDDGYGGWVFSMELVPTSQSIPSYSDANVQVYGYVTKSDGTEYYVLKVTPIYREDDFLEKIYELMGSEIDTIFNSIEWKSGYTFTKA